MRLRDIALSVIALMLVTQGVMAQSVQYADWYYTEKQDAFSDTDASVVFTPDKAKPDEASVNILCTPNGPTVLLVQQHPGDGNSDNRMLIRWRIDDNPASSTQRWPLPGSNNKSFYTLTQAVDRGFIQQARGGTTLYIRIEDPLGGEISDYEFSLMGFGAALSQLSCTS